MTGIKETKIELARDLGRSMAELRTYLRQFAQLKIKDQGINMTFEMIEVMSILWKKDGINQQEIANNTLKDKSSMTYLIDNLVKRNLVSRVEDDNDRRNKLIFLSTAGIALEQQLKPWVDEVYEMATVNLDIEDLKNGVAVLDKMVSNIKKSNI